MRVLQRVTVAIAWLMILPATALAQASLSGFVRDTSGAVLPGVTINLKSPSIQGQRYFEAASIRGRSRSQPLVPGRAFSSRMSSGRAAAGLPAAPAAAPPMATDRPAIPLSAWRRVIGSRPTSSAGL